MIKLDNFKIAKIWSEKNVNLNFSRNFVILTGHNGAGKSTILECLHDAFSLIHDGPIETNRNEYATELNFSGDVIVRSYVISEGFDIAEELRKKVEKEAKQGLSTDLFTSYERIKKIIKGNIQDADKAFLLKKDNSSLSTTSNSLTMQYNPQKVDVDLPQTIFFKDDNVFYNNINNENKKLEERNIFVKENNINKSLYLLLNEFNSKESQDKRKNKEEIKTELLAEIKKLNDEIETSNDDFFVSKIDDIIDKIISKRTASKSEGWGKDLFAAIDKFLTTTGRSVTRDDKGLIAFKLKSGKVVTWFNFSRGEKTLLVLLLSVFLNKSKDVIFILDEPDLSLHIEWQELLLPTLSKLAPERQFILSTHSPALIGNVEEQYINVAMEMI